LNQLIIFAAALVATGRRGDVVDLSAPPEQQVEAALVAVAELHAAVEAVRLAGEKAREVAEPEDSPDPDDPPPAEGDQSTADPGGSGAAAGGPAGKAS
jgi:hypothetical protein